MPRRMARPSGPANGAMPRNQCDCGTTSSTRPSSRAALLQAGRSLMLARNMRLGLSRYTPRGSNRSSAFVRLTTALRGPQCVSEKLGHGARVGAPVLPLEARRQADAEARDGKDRRDERRARPDRGEAPAEKNGQGRNGSAQVARDVEIRPCQRVQRQTDRRGQRQQEDQAEWRSERNPKPTSHGLPDQSSDRDDRRCGEQGQGDGFPGPRPGSGMDARSPCAASSRATSSHSEQRIVR